MAQESIIVRTGQELVVAPVGDRIHAKDLPDILDMVAADVMPARRVGAYTSYAIASTSAAADVNVNAQNSFRSASRTELEERCRELIGNRNDIICEPNVRFRTSKVPNDPQYSGLWGMTKIEAPSAWEISTGNRAVIAAVIDTGVSYNHPDLLANIAVNTNEIPNNGLDDDANGYVDDYYGYDFAYLDGDPSDTVDGHGTHVAGTIGGVGNNSAGVSGVNWEVGLVPIKVLDDSGSGSLADIAAGIDYAVTRGAHVINMSLGGPSGAAVLLQAIERATTAGVVIVMAAGNEAADNESVGSFPSNYSTATTISVAATGTDDNLADFSNYGASNVQIAAPGVDIISTFLNNGYDSLSGTSMATPHVAGVAALVKAANFGLSGSQIKDIILNTATPVSALQGFVSTSARLNANAAVASAIGAAPITTPPSSEFPALDSSITLEMAIGRSSSARVPVAVYLYDTETEEGYFGYKAIVYCNNKAVRSGVTDEFGEVYLRVNRPKIKKGGKKTTISCYAMIEGYSNISNKVRVSSLKTR